MTTENIENRVINRAVIQEIREEIGDIQNMADFIEAQVEIFSAQHEQISEKRQFVIDAVNNSVNKAYDQLEVLRTNKKKFGSQSADYQEQVKYINGIVNNIVYVLRGKIAELVESDVFGLSMKEQMKALADKFEKTANDYVDAHYYSRGTFENVKTATSAGFNEDSTRLAEIDADFEAVRTSFAELTDKLHLQAVKSQAKIEELQSGHKQVLASKKELTKQVKSAEKQLFSAAKDSVLSGSRGLRIVKFLIDKRFIRSKKLIALYDNAINKRAANYLIKHPEFNTSVVNVKPKTNNVEGTYSNTALASQDGEIDRIVEDFVVVEGQTVKADKAAEPKVEKSAENLVDSGASSTPVPMDDEVEREQSARRLG